MSVKSIFRPQLFAGKSALVTGGGTGIGKAITQELLHLGCNVMMASRKEETLLKTANELKSQISKENPAKLKWKVCNIRQEDQVKNTVEETIAQFGSLDFLVNNGGGQFPSPSEMISLKGWNAVIETNLTGTFLCCREAYNIWMREHGGVIVNIIADMWKGFPLMSHTGAARSAVDNLTKSLSVEWAKSGVRVNSVAPGIIYSKTAADNYKHFEGDLMGSQIPTIPAKRLGTPEEVSAAVCFLLSPASAFTSGISLRVDGAKSLFSSSLAFDNIPDHNKLPAYRWEDDVKKQGGDSNGKVSKL
ncbi:hypothetical protein CAPTEDRAFT_173279 [Capitella teleta]|uniref:Peroxisomal trans-2-enoyl-CoA reductase n=1 Tax=Capitella teleta TaxID=283909 RepID=R7UPV3_CAPTE|nr:hypothetical protein CAPTEDRAFT_173279 [Capitella teleta]|eukprot:ELU08220.1 hypothetical protein CAPTEDRAFT_173279 [Capitella teleta]